MIYWTAKFRVHVAKEDQTFPSSPWKPPKGCQLGGCRPELQGRRVRCRRHRVHGKKSQARTAPARHILGTPHVLQETAKNGCGTPKDTGQNELSGTVQEATITSLPIATSRGNGSPDLQRARAARMSRGRRQSHRDPCFNRN